MKMLCRLCISDCGQTSIQLLDSSGQNTPAYNVVAKYFGKEINNIEIKREFDFEQCIEFPSAASQVICDTCWHHINDFHKWQEEVITLQEECIKRLQQPYQREMVESVKLEMEMEVKNLDAFADSFVDDVCDDDDDYFNDDTVDPVAICEYGGGDASPINVPATEDKIDENGDKESDDDIPLIARKKATKNVTKNSTKSKTTKVAKKPQNRKKTTKKVNKKVTVESNEESDSESNADEDNKDEDKIREKSSKTKQFDAFIALHFKERLPCDLCEHQSADFTELRTHYRDVHNHNKGYVVCCRHKYSQRFHFVEHLQVHLDPQKFQCTECGKCSANGRSLVAHMKSMHAPTALERRFECEICHKKFAKQPILKTHMETHIQGSPDHVCKECGKGFVLESRLNIHIRNVHSTAYLSVCDQCGKSFRGRYALKYHLLEHEGVGKQRWPCDQCDAQLHSKFSLKRHKRISHHDGSKVYVCSECGKVALTEDALKSHKRYVHQRERIHKCTVCEKAFKASKVLKEHMTTHTGEDLYKCPHCPRTFKVNANLHHHRKRKHPLEWAANRRVRNMSFKRVDLNAINTISNELTLEQQEQVVL